MKNSRKLHQLELDIATRSVAQPHAHEMLDKLRSDGCHLGILTRNAKDIADVTLEAAGLSQFFEDEYVLGRDQCAPKPDPAGIIHLMKKWESSIQQTIMVGDYVFDLQAGRNAGVATIHFDTSAQFAWPQYTDFMIDRLNLIIE